MLLNGCDDTPSTVDQRSTELVKDIYSILGSCNLSDDSKLNYLKTSLNQVHWGLTSTQIKTSEESGGLQFLGGSFSQKSARSIATNDKKKVKTQMTN